MPTPSLRPLLYALALSLLLHVVLLVGTFVPLTLRLPAPAAVIKAVIVARPAVASLAAAPAPVGVATTAAVRPTPVAPPSEAPRHAPERAVLTAPAEPVVPDVALARPLRDGDVAPAGAAPAKSTAVAAPAPGALSANAAASATSPVSAPDGVSADDLRHYRLSLAIAARRFKRYPALASERGWEGTAEVAITVSPLLPTPQVLLMHSSGRRVLDTQAVDMLTQAARVATLPESLRGRDFRIVLPVEFSLDDDR